MSHLRHILFPLYGLIITACTHTAPNQNDAVQDMLPAQWQAGKNNHAISSNWLEDFSDSRLRSLVAQAMEYNFNLQAMRLRQKSALATAQIAGSLKFPNLSADLTGGRQRSVSTLGFSTDNQYTLYLSSYWEIDIWGQLRNEHAAALAHAEATRFDLEAFKLSLAGQVCRTWFNAIASQKQYQLAEESAQSYRKHLQTMETRYSKGLISAFELRSFRAECATAQVEVQQRLSLRSQILRQLEILLGQYPSDTRELPNELPKLDSEIPAGLPSELLIRRPDLRAFERRLAATEEKLNVARKNWLPRISLTASGGRISNELSDLSDPDFSIWSLFGNLSAPIFQAGRLKAERSQALANYQALLLDYKQKLISTFQEVETALSQQSYLKQWQEDIEVAQRESRAAESQAWHLYQKGLVDITAYLDAQRRSFSLQSEFISAQNELLQNRISLYVALGGGFSSENN